MRDAGDEPHGAQIKGQGLLERPLWAAQDPSHVSLNLTHTTASLMQELILSAE